MVRASLFTAMLLVVSACGGGDTAATTVAAAASTLPPAECPSGVLDARGDGPDYLNIVGSFAAAGEGRIPDGVPTHLGPAVTAIPSEQMVGLAYTGCSSLGGPSNFEEMAWSNGIGLMLVSWFGWPRVSDPSAASFGGEASQAGVVQVSRIETGTEDSRMRVVRLFDGLKVLSVSTYGLTTMGIDGVEQVAWAVYDGLPVDLEGAPEIGITVDGVLDIPRSDQRTVSEATPVSAVSPFTARAGAVHATFSAVIDGTDVLLYDFGMPDVAQRAAQMLSIDGYSIAHQPSTWSGEPHFWRLGRVIVLYQGSSGGFLEFLTAELGDPIATRVGEE
jgi:hypothetical protein